MSRARNARRKARRQAQAAAKPPPSARPPRALRLSTLVPVLAIVCILAATATLGFGLGSGKGQGQTEREVSALLAGVPQDGPTLGSPGAPITLQVYADLECPTVKLFVEKYLPGIVDRWVRPGVVKLEYRSLQTDTISERTFFQQEIAAQAAGRQDKMWNFLLTFVHEQGEEFSGYATDEFFTDIASQVPGLQPERWRDDREDALLSRRVALDVYSARTSGLRYTPSFALEFGSGWIDRGAGVKATPSLKAEFKDAFIREVQSLRQEASGDIPGLRFQP